MGRLLEKELDKISPVPLRKINWIPIFLSPEEGNELILPLRQQFRWNFLSLLEYQLAGEHENSK